MILAVSPVTSLQCHDRGTEKDVFVDENDNR